MANEKDKNKNPTMADVAKLAGVSAMTVSRALKSNEYIKQETREKIMQAVDALGYVMDSTAAGLSSRKTGFVAMIIPSINNANFAQTVRGVTEELSQNGLQLLLAYTNYSVEAEEKLVAQLLSRRPEAIILTGSSHTEKCANMLRNANIPVVEIWEKPEKPIAYSVGFSNFEASKIMAEHFHEKGCENLAFIGGDSETDRRGFERRQGFISSAKTLGLAGPKLIDLGPAPVSMEHGAQAAQKLMREGDYPDAVMCVSDQVAFGFLSECQRMGISIPEQVLLAGFGAYDISAVSNPTITTLDVYSYDIGLSAGKMTNSLLDEGNEEEIALQETTKITLLARQSSNS